MRYRISHPMNADADTYWNKIFFDKEYNDRLFKDHLRFSKFNVLEIRKEADGTVHKRVDCNPGIELPGAVKRVIGDLSGYLEEGMFDPIAKRYRANITPGAAADKIRTIIEIFVETSASGRSERVVQVDNEVKIFGVGRVAEKFLEQQLRSTYAAAAEFTNRWIAEKGLGS